MIDVAQGRYAFLPPRRRERQVLLRNTKRYPGKLNSSWQPGGSFGEVNP
jgi:hypothetical protein